VFYVATGQVIAGRRRLMLATVVAVLAFDAAYAVYLQVHGVRYGINSTIGPSTRVPVF
jgi:hypothetical protein